MTKLPIVSGKEVVRVLTKNGFYIKRQKGSHIILRRNDPFSQVTVPNHPVLDRGTLRSILNQSGLTIDDFVNLL